MAVSQTQLDALVEAYASGTLSVSYEGKSVTYRSMADLASAISTVAAALGVTNPLAAAATTQENPRVAVVRHNRG